MCLPPPEDDAMKSYVTVGLSVLAGAALFEAALIPGILIGGAVVLAPKYVRRGLRPLFGPTVRRRNAPKRPRAQRQELAAPPAAPARFGIKQAIAKTITFRIIVTTLDFTTNYVVIGELATAACLSTFNLVAGPVFYLAHETAWNYFGPAGADVRVPVGKAPADGEGSDEEGFTVSRALAKTITFRTLATVMDFTVNYVAVGSSAVLKLRWTCVGRSPAGRCSQGMKTAETVSSRGSRDAGQPSEMRHRVHEEGSMLEIMRRLGTATSSLHRGMKDTVDAVGELLVDAFHYLAYSQLAPRPFGRPRQLSSAWPHKAASLGDILLLFIYLEIGAMVGIYFKTTRLPVRYLIYVAITALGRVLIEIVGAEHRTGLDILVITGA